LNKYKKIAIYVFSSILGLVLIGAILTYVFEDKVKQFALAKINQYLDAEITAESIEFTLFQRFPNASLKFKNVLLKDKEANNDTILFAQDLYLKMSIWDLYDKKYDVKAIEVNKGYFNLKVNSSGKENYIFWKQEEVKDSVSDFSFALNQVKFKNSRICYINKVTKQDYKVLAYNLTLNGNFTSEEFELKASSNLFINHFKSSDISYISNQESKFNTEMLVNTVEKSLRINIANLKVAELNFKTGGYYNYESGFIEYVVMGDDIELTELFSVFSEDIFKDVTQYKSKGVLDFSAKIEGKSSKLESPTVTADFEIENGSLTEQKNNITLSQLNLKGSYYSATKKEPSKLYINQFSGNFEDGNFSGEVSLNDLNYPDVSLNCSGKLNLNTLFKFFPSEKLKSLSGEVDFKTKITGKIVNESFNLKQSEGDLTFNKLNLELTDNNLAFSNLSGDFELRKNHAYISNLNGNVNSTQFKMEGYFQNFLPYILLTNEKLVIEADVWVGKANLKELMDASKSKSTVETSSTPNVDMNFRLRADEITYGKLEAKNIHTNVKIIDKNIYYQNLKFDATQGSYASNGELVLLKNNNYWFNGIAYASKVDASDFFYQLDNFGQEYLKNNNIKGFVDADITFSMELDDAFNIIPSSIIANSNLHFDKGELVDVSLINEIVEYMVKDWKVKPFVDEKLLIQKAKHIKFDALDMTVIIKDEKINILYTEVRSSFIDINGQGIHSFNHDLDYKFDFRLKDILVKKQPDTESEFGGYEVEDKKSGIRVFVKVGGNVDAPKYGYDMMSHKKYLEVQKEQEKQSVKSILKDEFGLFKKDTSLLAKPKEEQAKAKFVVDWDEMDKEEKVDSTSINSDKNIQEKEKKKKERMDKFVKKLGGEQNKETETKFKIDE
jgi:hypothetical protein